jgi:hypothetical protein
MIKETYDIDIDLIDDDTFKEMEIEFGDNKLCNVSDRQILDYLEDRDIKIKGVNA